MIVGTGIDITETARIEQAMGRHGERFARRVYTPGEITYCEQFKNKAERYAARFAAKEAAFKALGRLGQVPRLAGETAAEERKTGSEQEPAGQGGGETPEVG